MLEYHYSAFGELFNKSNDYSGLIKELFDNNIYIYKGYCYDYETGLYYCNSRYYNPEIGRWISPDNIDYLDPESINGFNLYVYCGNSPVMINAYTEPIFQAYGISAVNEITSDRLCSISDRSGLGNARNAISSGGIFKKKSSSFVSKLFNNDFKFASAQLRSSDGWDSSPIIATGWFGRFGVSSYFTKTKGSDGLFYVFGGYRTDITYLEGVEYYAGVGLNLWNTAGAEFELKTIGAKATISIWRFSVALDVNLLGCTSITLGWDSNLGNGLTRTDGFTIGINTGFLVIVVGGVYKLVTQGDSSWLEQGWRMIFE